MKGNIYSRTQFFIEASGKCICCSVIGNALGKCQFVVDKLFWDSQAKGLTSSVLPNSGHPRAFYKKVGKIDREPKEKAF